jgi:hypothetical protein
MEARAQRLAAMVPVHRKREADALEKAAELERQMDSSDSTVDSVSLCDAYSAEMQRARTEANTCTLYEHCISQWKST